MKEQSHLAGHLPGQIMGRYILVLDFEMSRISHRDGVERILRWKKDLYGCEEAEIKGINEE